jgi:hypothetical protein
MDFLLECIGFPPGHDLEDLVTRVRREGESVAWRGPHGVHLRYPLPGGLEVRLDREGDESPWTLWPHYEVRRRLRVAVDSVQPLPDSPFDALLRGQANPPSPVAEPDVLARSYPLATYVSDARRLPQRVPPGHVLAVSVAGFALDVSYLGPNDGVRDARILEEAHGAALAPLGSSDHLPGGCMEVSLRIKELRSFLNPLTGLEVALLEADAPGRPLDLFVSRWQLEADGLEAPRPGWRIEGAFLFTGRASGGLVPLAGARPESFG